MSRIYRRRSAISIAQAATTLSVVTVIAAGMVLASEIILALFLAVLFGVFLHRMALIIGHWMPLSYGWSITTVVALMLLTGAMTASLFYVQIDRRIESASEQIDTSLEKLRQLTNESPITRSIVQSIPFVSEIMEGQTASGRPSSGGRGSTPSEDASAQRSELPNSSRLSESVKRVADTVGRIFETTLGMVVNILLVFFVGLFLAISPQTYRQSVIRLVPPTRRERASKLMNELGETLWQWLLGRFGSMLVTGLGAAVILWLIGVPMAGSLGILTGLLTFIPNIGAAIALLVSILFALPQGTTTTMLVLPGFIGLQLIESYVVTPLIQQRQVLIPPALLIAFQAIMSVLLGILGATVASPLLAALKVMIEQLYVEDVLEADVERGNTPA